MSTQRVKFEALVTTDIDKDIPLADALTAIDHNCPVQRFSATRLPGGIVSVRVEFWVANLNEAYAKAREVAESLQHHWPTDSVTINGQSIKYVHRETEK